MKKSYYDQENKLCFFMSPDEERAYYNEVLERVIANPRKYLDNLDNLDVFCVSFINYTSSDKKSLKNAKLYK